MKYDIDLVRTRSLTEIHKYVDDLTIYRHYISGNVNVNSKLQSPLREDKHPSFSIYPVSGNKLMWKDFSTGESGDIVKLVRLKYGLTSKKALRRIWSDLCEGKKPADNIINIPTNSRLKFVIEKRRLTNFDKGYWGQYCITPEVLKKYNVTPISRFWYGKSDDDMRESKMIHKKENPLYAYSIYGSYKIYKPLSTNRSYKWRSNTNKFDIQGLEQLPDKGDLLIITKSLKDVMVLYVLGYNAIAPQTEAGLIPQVIMEHLSCRFKKIIILYDNDETGLKNSANMSLKYNIDNIMIPIEYGVKDISDYIETYGADSAKQLLGKLLNTNNND